MTARVSLKIPHLPMLCMINLEPCYGIQVPTTKTIYQRTLLAHTEAFTGE